MLAKTIKIILPLIPLVTVSIMGYSQNTTNSEDVDSTITTTIYKTYSKGRETVTQTQKKVINTQSHQTSKSPSNTYTNQQTSDQLTDHTTNNDELENEADNTQIQGQLSVKLINEIAVQFHNKVRREIGTPDVNWSSEVAAFAQSWAEHLAKGCYLEHSDRSANNYGENIAEVYGEGKTMQQIIEEACQLWYDEKKDFSPSDKIFDMDKFNKYGHYSQMIWRNTTTIGIGVAKCSNNYYIVVGDYNPPGNYMGQEMY